MAECLERLCESDAVVLILGEKYGTVTAYALVVFTLGGMHVFYDGFIWKLRRPNVANSLGVPAPPA